jgi:glutaredoxin 3
MPEEGSETKATGKRKVEAAKNDGQKAPEVIVYSTPQCPFCTMAKAYLTGRGIRFTEYDVSKDRQRAEEMIAKTGQGGVPVLQINGRMIVGFDRDQIDTALSKPPPPKRDVVVGNIIFDPFNI